MSRRNNLGKYKGGNMRGGRGVDYDGRVNFQRGNNYIPDNRSTNPQHNDDNAIVWLSKSLSYVLRHNADREGLNIRPDGYVKVEELVRLPKFKGTTLEKIQLAIKENDKQGLTLIEQNESGESIWWIKANKDEDVNDLELQEITDPSKIPQVIYKTYLNNWESIKSKGLSKMNSNHIRLAVEKFDDPNVKGGMRSPCDLFIYINVPKAMNDGIKFYRSANGVILTKGNKGKLYKNHFLKVVDKNERILYPGEKSEKNNVDIVYLSKSLSYVLRHNAHREGLNLQSDGYVKLEELMKLPRFRQTTFENIQLVVKENDKQRFTLIEKTESDESGKPIWWIRANQGHSIEDVNNLELEEITDPSKIPQVIHGTYLKKWASIKSNGLSKMNRNHMHFATGKFGDPKVKSGMRRNCDLFIYVNVPKAMKDIFNYFDKYQFTDGIKFHRSANGVILTEGIEGKLDKKYFLKVVDKNEEIIYSEKNSDENSLYYNKSYLEDPWADLMKSSQNLKKNGLNNNIVDKNYNRKKDDEKDKLKKSGLNNNSVDKNHKRKKDDEKDKPKESGLNNNSVDKNHKRKKDDEKDKLEKSGLNNSSVDKKKDNEKDGNEKKKVFSYAEMAKRTHK
ncbi:KptA family-domain-containing protein [Glomus cerebriforme]|uniref:2'-phosphotransferase n=1 Tax=Glomus cerebriforme TaxID=658196 RepID=A0A397SS17_9GLOM|nr:KptA family-domain-containing protein [Glomus cerebriforme]